MDRCAVLVDAGYLLGAAGSLITQSPDRSTLTVDFELLMPALAAEARSQTQLPVLRIYWYDGAREARPNSEHLRIRALPDVKVRLGELVFQEGRTVQKGVDSYLQRDLTTLARNRAVTDIILVGGDEDLRRGVEEAQDFGVRIHLWAVEAGGSLYNQSLALIGEADRRWVMSHDWVARYMRGPGLGVAPADDSPSAPAGRPPEHSVTSADPDEAAAASSDDSAAVDARLQLLRQSLDEQGHPLATGGIPTPAQLARIVRPPARVTPSQPPDDVPRLRNLTNSHEAWRDRERDLTGGLTAYDAGLRFGGRWADRATPEQRDRVLARLPSVPHSLDGELLGWAEQIGIDTRAEDEGEKHAVRDGFWDALRGVREGVGSTVTPGR